MPNNGRFAKPVDYTIVSKPDYIKLECPHCHHSLEIPFDDVNFYASNWAEGGEVDCPDCNRTVILGEYEYE